MIRHLPNFGETYLFNNDYVINVTGLTGTGIQVGDKLYWDDIAAGKPIGEAFRDLLKLRIYYSIYPPDPQHELLGDPTMS